jgi:hypothetical protein
MCKAEKSDNERRQSVSEYINRKLTLGIYSRSKIAGGYLSNSLTAGSAQSSRRIKQKAPRWVRLVT